MGWWSDIYVVVEVMRRVFFAQLYRVFFVYDVEMQVLLDGQEEVLDKESEFLHIIKELVERLAACVIVPVLDVIGGYVLAVGVASCMTSSIHNKHSLTRLVGTICCDSTVQSGTDNEKVVFECRIQNAKLKLKLRISTPMQI